MSGRAIDVFLLRYVPNILEGSFVNIGVLLVERYDGAFAACRFLSGWEQVRSLDPSADIEVLELLTLEIELALRQPSERQALLQRMVTSFSNALQLCLKETIVTDDPANELERQTATLRRSVRNRPNLLPSFTQ